MDDEHQPERFQEGWQRDYFASDSPQRMRKRLEDDWTRELLVADYQQASEDGRNRDNLLHNSYYVGLVLLGLILNVGLQLVEDGAYVALFGLSSVGAVLYLLLFLWSSSSKGAREASWDRRSEIEDMVKTVDSQLLRSNDSCFKRLTRIDDGTYRLEGKNRVEKHSIGRLILYTNLLIALGLGGAAVWSLLEAVQFL